MNEYKELVHTEDYEGFGINLYFQPEHDQPDWDFKNEGEKKELLRQIDNGLILWVRAEVTASKCGVVLGHSYLGHCCYETKQDLIDDVLIDMRDQAMENAKLMLKELMVNR